MSTSKGVVETSSITRAPKPGEQASSLLQEAIEVGSLERSFVGKPSEEQNSTPWALVMDKEGGAPAPLSSCRPTPSVGSDDGELVPMTADNSDGGRMNESMDSADNQLALLASPKSLFKTKSDGKVSQSTVEEESVEGVCQSAKRSRPSSLDDTATVGVLPQKPRPNDDHDSRLDATDKTDWLDEQRKMAADYQEEGDLMFAREVLLSALPTAIRATQERLRGTAYLGQYYAELANICDQLGDTAEAIDYYTNAANQEREALAGQYQRTPSQLGMSHFRGLVQSLEAICRIYVELSHFNNALCVYKEIYDIQVDVAGANSLEVATTLCNMGLMHYMLQLYSPSLLFYQETLRVSLAVLEEFQNPQNSDATRIPKLAPFTLARSIGDSLNAMGLLYLKLKRLDEATSAFSCSLMVREKIMGPYHREVTILWYNLAMVRIEAFDARRAIPLYKEGLRRDRIGLGDAYHPDVSPTLQYLGEMYNQLGELDDSRACFQEALEIEIRAALRLSTAANAATCCVHRSCNKHMAAICRLCNVIGNLHLM